MKTLTVFDPAMCHSTGVCGSDVDQVLVAFSVDVYWLKGRGLQVERYNLAQQPMSFVHDEKAKAFLKASGADGLSLQLLDGETVMGGRYPKCAELARWFGIPLVRYPAGEGKVHGFACVLQTLNPPLVPALARPVPAVHLH
ncbi:TPA: arsenite efflux transporter metallochaperone ArsD [Klebsiella quasipneumoniae]|nr:arsenite efflux transporter metallochaperone ArsD [Klebsiella quasipneumoniae]